ncbi:MAG: molecular chaperone HtpG, partial [Lachnospiraceae bacterium]|nr:molecular chaperone HtpG [Lachnospiraceae bacterium]
MSTRTGNLSINSENMLPIIKKWMYSDHDIFVREMISNGCDAITKLRKLAMLSEYEYPEDHKDSIQVIVDPDTKTLKFIDTGLGMTAGEVEEYITQIAFSGATAFLEKYKDKTDKDEIIGHFGLGFFSAFMVSDMVEIDTLSYQKDAQPVHWECDGGSEYVIEDGTFDRVGTCITLHLNEDSVEFSNEYRMREVLQKYCGFMPVEIYLSRANAEQAYETIDEEDLRDDDVVVERIHEEARTEERENENGEKETVEISPALDRVKINKRPVPVNDTAPLWTKHPNECTDEEYRDFYRKVFADYKEPLFWIHLNMDYPFNLKGILYFPKINLEYETIEGTIKLYNNQVFIADNIKEVIPEFLMLLKGVIDCPDLPLNVSRSALQNDGFVKKIADYITKKVADKLSGMCKTDRENYEKYWDDISPFIKFGCLKDEKFSERMMDYILYKDIDGKYSTQKEYLEAIRPAQKLDVDEDAAQEKEDVPESEAAGEETKDGASEEDKEKEPEKTTIFYVTDEQQQGQYINMFRENGQNAVILKHSIDSAFITHVEQKDETVRFQRIDADINEAVREEDDEDLTALQDSLKELFGKALGNDKLEIRVEKLKNPEVSSVLTLSEESRRMQEMMKMYNMYGMDLGNMAKAPGTLVLNANHPLVKYIFEHKRSKNVPLICQQLYDL